MKKIIFILLSVLISFQVTAEEQELIHIDLTGKKLELYLLSQSLFSSENIKEAPYLHAVIEDISKTKETHVLVERGTFSYSKGTLSFLSHTKERLIYSDRLDISKGSHRELKAGELKEFSELTLMEDSREVYWGNRIYKDLPSLVDRLILNKDHPDFALNFHKLYEIFAIYLPQSQIKSFASMKMGDLYREKHRFFAFNQIDQSHPSYFELQFSSDSFLGPFYTKFFFYNYSDFPIMTFEGVFISKASVFANGPLEGTVEFLLKGRQLSLKGHFLYNTITVKKSVPYKGNYLLKLDNGKSFTIPYNNIIPGEIDFKSLILN